MSGDGNNGGKIMAVSHDDRRAMARLIAMRDQVIAEINNSFKADVVSDSLARDIKKMTLDESFRMLREWGELQKGELIEKGINETIETLSGREKEMICFQFKEGVLPKEEAKGQMGVIAGLSKKGIATIPKEGDVGSRLTEVGKQIQLTLFDHLEEH